jgi:hypothetical protein
VEFAAAVCGQKIERRKPGGRGAAEVAAFITEWRYFFSPFGAIFFIMRSSVYKYVSFL